MAGSEQPPKRSDLHGTSDRWVHDRVNIDLHGRPYSNNPNANTPLFVVIATYC